MENLKNNLGLKLDKTTYRMLFPQSNTTLLDSIWNDGNVEKELFNIIKNKNINPFTKLKAAEILYHYQVEISKGHHKSLAEAYAYSLAHTSYEKKEYTSLSGNLWGLLYEHDDAGILGLRFLVFEELAIPSLVELLNDDDKSILYEGSQEATTGNSYEYRVKDFAAFYISKIKDIPITFYHDFEKRDAEIERLKEILENK